MWQQNPYELSFALFGAGSCIQDEHRHARLLSALDLAPATPRTKKMTVLQVAKGKYALCN